MSSCILPRLRIGDFQDANNATFSEYQHIITLHNTKPCINPLITHVFAPILDEVYLERSVWTELVDCLTATVKRPGRTLVHCRLGKSRSVALTAAYMARHGWTPEEALEYIKFVRPIADPHEKTWQSVLDWYYGVR